MKQEDLAALIKLLNDKHAGWAWYEWLRFALDISAIYTTYVTLLTLILSNAMDFKMSFTGDDISYKTLLHPVIIHEEHLHSVGLA